ncbi:hypothetical protein FB157_120182 [Streptomyces sp. BK340]|nr:hypothetical protein FB157_120182 [Streptomyces sp. BK340]
MLAVGRRSHVGGMGCSWGLAVLRTVGHVRGWLGLFAWRRSWQPGAPCSRQAHGRQNLTAFFVMRGGMTVFLVIPVLAAVYLNSLDWQDVSYVGAGRRSARRGRGSCADLICRRRRLLLRLRQDDDPRGGRVVRSCSRSGSDRIGLWEDHSADALPREPPGRPGRTVRLAVPAPARPVRHTACAATARHHLAGRPPTGGTPQRQVRCRQSGGSPGCQRLFPARAGDCTAQSAGPGTGEYASG